MGKTLLHGQANLERLRNAIFSGRLAAVRLVPLLLVLWTAANQAAPDQPRRIAITFDDAPRPDGVYFSGPARTEALIDGLARAGVHQAAFFVTTGHLRGRSEERRLQAYAAAGHVLANHSHRHSGLSDTPVGAYLEDIDQAESALRMFSNRRPWFRYPFLDAGRPLEKLEQVRSGLADRGLAHGYVTVDNYDWYLDALATDARRAGTCVDRDALRALYVETLVQAAEFYDAIAQRWLGRSPVHVLLLHENDLAALFIESLVAELGGNGWTVVSADVAYRDPLARLSPRTLFNNQGQVAAVSHALGAEPADLVHEREDRDALERLFATRVVEGCDPEAVGRSRG